MRIAELLFEHVLEIAVVARYIRAGAAHVEGDHFLETGLPAHARRAHHAAGRTAQQAVFGAELIRLHQAAGAGHHVQPSAADGLAHLLQIGADDRREVRIHHRGLGPLQQLDEGRYLVRAGDVPETEPLQTLRQPLLMFGIHVTVHQRNGRHIDAAFEQRLRPFGDSIKLQRPQDLSLGIEALRNLDHGFIKRRRFADVQREQVRPLLRADEQQVAETLRHEQRHACALAFEQRIGAARGGQPHGQWRQRLRERRLRHQPRRQNGRRLGRSHFKSLVRLHLRVQRLLQFDGLLAGIVPPDSGTGLRSSQQVKRATSDEIIRSLPGGLHAKSRGRERLGYHAAQGAAGQHFGAPPLPVRGDGETVGKRAAGIHPDVPEAAIVVARACHAEVHPNRLLSTVSFT